MDRPGLTRVSNTSPSTRRPLTMRTAANCTIAVALIGQQTGGFGIKHHIGQIAQRRVGHGGVSRLGQQVEIIDDGPRNGFRAARHPPGRVNRHTQRRCSVCGGFGPDFGGMGGQNRAACDIATRLPTAAPRTASIAPMLHGRHLASQAGSSHRRHLRRWSRSNLWPKPCATTSAASRAKSAITSKPLQRNINGAASAWPRQPFNFQLCAQTIGQIAGPRQRQGPAIRPAPLHGAGSGRSRQRTGPPPLAAGRGQDRGGSGHRAGSRPARWPDWRQGGARGQTLRPASASRRACAARSAVTSRRVST